MDQEILSCDWVIQVSTVVGRKVLSVRMTATRQNRCREISLLLSGAVAVAV